MTSLAAPTPAAGTPEGILALAIDHHRKGDFQRAEALYQRILEANPRHADALTQLGVLALQLGDHIRAADLIGQAVGIDDGIAVYHFNFGAALDGLGRFDDAVAAYRRAIELEPGFAGAHDNIGITLMKQGRLAEAVVAHCRAIELEPGFAAAYNNLGNVLTAASNLDEAIAAYRRAIELDPQLAQAYNNLGNVLKSRGCTDEAVGAYRKSLALDPGYAVAHMNLLFCLCHDAEVTPADILAEARRWNERHAAPLAARARPHANDPDPERRLRVGYVSPDFRRHAVDYFLEPLLTHHDRGAVEIFCYAEVALPDARTDRYRELADHWRSTVGLRNEQVAERIREDRIDILVDLAGHTANNRLLAFAERPAPVQVSHLVGLGQTTGMAAMDYVLGDRQLIPDGHGERFTEAPWRLPRCFVSFQPQPAWPEVTPLPARDRGHVTFAAFGEPSRIAPPTLAMWADVLTATPGARLLLKHHLLADPGLRARLHDGFAAHGVAERVEFAGVERGWGAEMDVYEGVDIALDSYPMTGTATACIVLWMGLPVVTLASPEAHDRFAAGFLHTIGLDDCVASDADDFVRRAAALAGDLDRLAELRAGLRRRMGASELLDHEGCARALEDAYRGMWRKWCAGRE